MRRKVPSLCQNRSYPEIPLSCAGSFKLRVRASRATNQLTSILHAKADKVRVNIRLLIQLTSRLAHTFMPKQQYFRSLWTEYPRLFVFPLLLSRAFTVFAALQIVCSPVRDAPRALLSAAGRSEQEMQINYGTCVNANVEQFLVTRDCLQAKLASRLRRGIYTLGEKCVSSSLYGESIAVVRNIFSAEMDMELGVHPPAFGNLFS